MTATAVDQDVLDALAFDPALPCSCRWRHPEAPPVAVWEVWARPVEPCPCKSAKRAPVILMCQPCWDYYSSTARITCHARLHVYDFLDQVLRVVRI